MVGSSGWYAVVIGDPKNWISTRLVALSVDLHVCMCMHKMVLVDVHEYEYFSATL